VKSEIKRIGDAILAHVRFVVRETAKGDADFEFKLNRWVFSRLLLDGRKQSKPIKQKLWDSGMQSCQICKKKFSNIKGVEIHRKNSSLGYSVENCDLLCRPCHQNPNSKQGNRTRTEENF
jgi:hypothetical protein